MKRFIPIITLSFVCVGAYAQQKVGIFTEDPQTSLHISGTPTESSIGQEGQKMISPTIRVESLNKANNPDYFQDDIISTPLSVNEHGDLILSENIKADIPNFDVSNLSFYRSRNKNLTTGSYTLTNNLVLEKEALVHIQAPLTFFLHHADVATQLLNNNTANATLYSSSETKRLYTYFKIIDENGGMQDIISGLSDEFLFNRSNRNNGGSGVPNTVITETFLRLPAGTYSIEQVYGYDLGAENKSEPDYKGFFRTNPDNNNNNYSITVYPL